MVQAVSRIRCRRGELQIHTEQNGQTETRNNAGPSPQRGTPELQPYLFKEKPLNTENITVAKFIDHQISHNEKLQEKIAAECGFASSNIISMIKNGVTKLPLAKVGVMAKALDVDPTYLLRLTMTEYMPEVWSIMEDIFGRSSFVTAGELELLGKLRQRAHGLPINASSLDQRLTVEEAEGAINERCAGNSSTISTGRQISASGL